MDRSELDEFLVDLVGPRIDEKLARELAAVQPGVCRVRGWRAYIRVRWRFRRFRSGPQSGSHRHVSSPCSPNPACRFPAPGSPVGSCASHTDRQGDLGMQVVCGRGTASALHSHPVSGAPSSLFTPRQHRTRTVRLLDLCM